MRRAFTNSRGEEVWTPPKCYAAYEMMGGMVLGLVGAMTRLLFSIIGSSMVGKMVGKHLLELIRVYLTFPMGEESLRLENAFAISAGVCLYPMTGMVGAGGWGLGGVRFVVATTHLVFAWTMLMFHRWGEFVPCERAPKPKAG